MGASCCGPIEEEEKYDDQITDKMRLDRLTEGTKYKLLLLGAGESGKSTLLKQMKQIHGEKFTRQELLDAKPYIVQNIVEAIRTLAIYSELLAEQHGKDTRVLPENEEVRTRVAMLSDKHILGEREIDDFVRLWKDPGIKRTYEERANFQLIDTAEYLFQQMHNYSDPNYTPTFNDLIHSRKRTTGVNKIDFRISNEDDNLEVYEVYDVGGQRNERRKWIHCFDNVSAIIFVAALSGYDQTLWEDNRMNRMKEALALFRSIVNMECFAESHMILFLNKSDLFTNKIQQVPLKDYFPNFSGQHGNVEQALRFIEEQFISQRANKSKIIYCHITCATNQDNVDKVFDSVRDIVVRKELNLAGLL